MQISSFVGQVMTPYHYDKMSERAQGFRITPFWCSVGEVDRLVWWVRRYVGTYEIW